jgi:hypothetical protein
MSSSFLAFDLVGRNANLECERNARGFVHPKFDDGEEAVGLVVRGWHPTGPGMLVAVNCGNALSTLSIIKENRTYDQVLGDLDRGNGDPYISPTPRADELFRKLTQRGQPGLTALRTDN